MDQRPTEDSDGADARVARARSSAKDAEAEPLSGRLLMAIAEQPESPSTLARELGVSPETVSRKLRTLRESGLIEAAEVFGDSRRRAYALTTEGRVQLGRLRAFAAPEPAPPPPNVADVERMLRSGIRHAVAMRRRANELEQAADRLRLVIREAEKAQLPELTVEATSELATTLRQLRAGDEVRVLLERLAHFASSPEAPASVALPAAAHRLYGLGRLDEQRGERLSERAAQLTTAATLYAQLAGASAWGPPETWRQREAWSLLGLANNLRAQTRFEPALLRAAAAARSFEEFEDPYGRSHALFTLGFCLRLLGEFDHAWYVLDQAHRIAEEHSFERFRADSLMQLGEVRRCQGVASEARALLSESIERAEYLKLPVIQAFARSALGAVEYHEQRFPEAESELRCAQRLFEHWEHREGLALNTRRLAVVARSLLQAGIADDPARVTGLIAAGLDRYRVLGSPAGIVACEIELGRLERSGGKLRPVIVRLIRRLDDTPQRNLLELDPWVPHVLHTFAGETGDEALSERALRLLESAWERLEQRLRAGAARATELAGVSARRQTAAVSIDEMGGEARADKDALAPLVAA
ncbi:MAG TPA: helix-turn-helix domain-containing protein [Solirubrobacter sp.]|nr:helix-turn-helix domain-containing protein [Solirubrobacter sp.]